MTDGEGGQALELARGEWEDFFDRVNRRIEEGERLEASIEVVGELGDQTEAEHLPLDGITFEEGDDEIAIILGGRGRRYPAVLEHYVEHPRRIWIREDGGEPSLIAIDTGGEGITVVRLRPE
ncbi:MAG: DUF5335 family protein [Thermoleophilaceae bacterium]|nr:DUF5335 family protein [Thermoleophilaceae bacterium]